MLLSLENKVAFITGSTRGIELASARALARSGASIILNGAHDEDVLRGCAHQIQQEFGVECIGLLANAADASAVAACYAAILQRFGRLDILVNNAGIPGDASLEMASPEMIQEVFGASTLGSIYHLQEASRLMSRKQSGSIINISSIVGHNGNEGHSVHAASKAALLGLTYAAAKELAPMNIRVNAIAPGFIRTETTAALSENQYAERLASVKMGRIGQPEDVANAVLFFASDLSTYITGQVLAVDGAMLI